MITLGEMVNTELCMPNKWVNEHSKNEYIDDDKMAKGRRVQQLVLMASANLKEKDEIPKLVTVGEGDSDMMEMKEK